MRSLFALQREAVAADPMPSLQRLDRIRRVGQVVTEREPVFRVAMQDDFGSIHPSMVVMLDTYPVIDRSNYFVGQPRRMDDHKGRCSRTRAWLVDG